MHCFLDTPLDSIRLAVFIQQTLLSSPMCCNSTILLCIGVSICQKHLARQLRTTNQYLLSGKPLATIHWLLDVSDVSFVKCSTHTSTLVVDFPSDNTNTRTRHFSQLCFFVSLYDFLCFCLRSTFSFQRSILRLSLFLFRNSYPLVFFFS